MAYDVPVVLGPNFTISIDIYTAHRAQFRLERTANTRGKIKIGVNVE
jgi:hypothetical protein